LLSEQSIAAKPGIYLWTIPYRRGGYLVSYVGETSVSFGQRLKDHVIQTMGGNYRICEAELLVDGEVKVLWNGLWRRGTRDKMLEYLEQAEHLAPLARRELQLTSVFVAPLHVPTRFRRRIEGGLAQHIRNQESPTSSLLPDDIRYHQRRDSEEPVLIEVRCPEPVHGLPTFVEV
jgi:hypothetical protein